MHGFYSTWGSTTLLLYVYTSSGSALVSTLQPLLSTNPIHCKNHEVTITCMYSHTYMHYVLCTGKSKRSLWELSFSLLVKRTTHWGMGDIKWITYYYVHCISLTHSAPSLMSFCLSPTLPCLQPWAFVSDVWVACEGGSQYSQPNDHQGRATCESNNAYVLLSMHRVHVYFCNLCCVTPLCKDLVCFVL